MISGKKGGNAEIIAGLLIVASYLLPKQLNEMRNNAILQQSSNIITPHTKEVVTNCLAANRCLEQCQITFKVLGQDIVENINLKHCVKSLSIKYSTSRPDIFRIIDKNH